MSDPTPPAHLVVEHDPDAAPGIGGVVWKLPHAGDLDGNLVRLAADRSIEEHVNGEVDVLLVVRSGSGTLAVDGATHPLTDRSVALVPKGTSRSIVAGPDGIAYLSIHRHRSGPTIAPAVSG